MKQAYHSNASTNLHMRLEISKSNLTNSELAIKYNISEPTVSKWRNRDVFEDKSSKPYHIHYALDDIEHRLTKPGTPKTNGLKLNLNFLKNPLQFNKEILYLMW